MIQYDWLYVQNLNTESTFKRYLRNAHENEDKCVCLMFIYYNSIYIMSENYTSLWKIDLVRTV